MLEILSYYIKGDNNIFYYLRSIFHGCFGIYISKSHMEAVYMHFSDAEIFHAELRRLEDEYRRCPDSGIRSLIQEDIQLMEQAIATAESL
jgi:hypothetical protein